MIPVLVPPIVVVVLGVTSTALYRNRKRGVLTPEREKIYQAALQTLKSPEGLRKLAAAYRREGLRYQADQLEKRAKLRELPESEKLKRQEIYRKALKSKNKQAIRQLARAFYDQGCTAAAASLNQYADGLP